MLIRCSRRTRGTWAGRRCASPEAARRTVPADVLALFDLDHTLLTLDSDDSWVEHLVERKLIDRKSFEERNRIIGEGYRRGEVGVLEFTEFYLSTLASTPMAS